MVSKKSKKDKKAAISIPQMDLTVGIIAVITVVAGVVYSLSGTMGEGTNALALRYLIFSILTALVSVVVFFYCVPSIKIPFEKQLRLAIYSSIGILFLSTISTGWFFGGDSGHYVGLTRSLGLFEGFMELHTVDVKPHTLYGFGLPLLLVPIFWLFGANIFAMNLGIVLYAIVLIIVVYYMFRPSLSKPLLYLLLLLVAVNSWIVMFSAVVMTETPFLLFLALSCIAVEKYANEETHWNIWLVAVVAAAFMTYEVKVIGVALIPSIFLYFLIRKNYKKAFLASSLIFLLFLMWNLRNYFAGSLGYFESLLGAVTAESGAALGEHDTGRGLLGNLFVKPVLNAIKGGNFLTPMAFSVEPGVKEVPYQPFYNFMLILTYTGLVVNFWFRRALYDIFSVIFFVGISIYAGVAFPERWWFAFVPFVIFYIIVGWEFYSELLMKKFPSKGIELFLKYALVVSLTIMFGAGLKYSSLMIHTKRIGKDYSAPQHEAFARVADWVRDNTPKDALVASRLDKEFFLISERQGENSKVFFTYDYTYSEEVGQEIIGNMIDLIGTYNIDYWILDNTRGDSRLVLVTLLRNQEMMNKMFRVVYGYPEEQGKSLAYVLEINKEWVMAEYEKRKQ